LQNDTRWQKNTRCN